MNDQKFNVNNLRIASPCSVGWESMGGNERVRLCHSCHLNIYNTAEMTSNEVETLIKNREGRLCIRLYKRADGTILTKDCPVGFRAYRKRVTRLAGAALATILGLFSTSFGQKEDKDSSNTSITKIVRTVNQGQESELMGKVLDPNGAVIPSVEIKLYKEGNKKPVRTKSNEDGDYSFRPLSEGIYKLEIKTDGFHAQKIIGIEVKRNESILLNLVLVPGSINVTVGIFTDEPLVDTSSSTIKTVFTRRQIENLPH